MALSRWPDFTPRHGRHYMLLHGEAFPFHTHKIPSLEIPWHTVNELKSPNPHRPVSWHGKADSGPLGASRGLNNVPEAKAGHCPPHVQVPGASCLARLQQQPSKTQGGHRVLPGARALRGLAAGRPEPSEPLAKEHPHRKPRPGSYYILVLLYGNRLFL